MPSVTPSTLLECIYGDFGILSPLRARCIRYRGYDSEDHRQELRRRRVTPVIARRGTEHSSGLGQVWWAVERTLCWFSPPSKNSLYRAFLGGHHMPLTPHPGPLEPETAIHSRLESGRFSCYF